MIKSTISLLKLLSETRIAWNNFFLDTALDWGIKLIWNSSYLAYRGLVVDELLHSENSLSFSSLFMPSKVNFLAK